MCLAHEVAYQYMLGARIVRMEDASKPDVAARRHRISKRINPVQVLRKNDRALLLAVVFRYAVLLLMPLLSPAEFRLVSPRCGLPSSTRGGCRGTSAPPASSAVSSGVQNAFHTVRLACLDCQASTKRRPADQDSGDVLEETAFDQLGVKRDGPNGRIILDLLVLPGVGDPHHPYAAVVLPDVALHQLARFFLSATLVGTDDWQPAIIVGVLVFGAERCVQSSQLSSA